VTVPYYTRLYCTILNHTVLYCTVLYCTVRASHGAFCRFLFESHPLPLKEHTGRVQVIAQETGVSEAAYHPFFVLVIAVVISERGDVREGEG
jgi:hypothetical protein